MSNQVEILNREICFEGFFRVDRYTIRHGLFEGGLSQPITREVFERGHSVAVLPYDAERDVVVLVEQFRAGALDAPSGPWIMEVVAGMIDQGHTPEEIAHKELREEANLTASELEYICEYLVSPGGTSERVKLYCARVDAEGAGGIHGRDDEGEDIRVHVVPFEEAWDMLQNGVINNAMGIIVLQWLALNRERLRDLWTA